MKAPKKTNVKTVEGKGLKVTYSDNPNNNRIVSEVLAAMEAKQAEREQRKLTQPIPDLTPTACLVAFIDILGFGSEIARASTKEDLERIHAKVATVKREFLKESAADDPDEQGELNNTHGRRVIALSDAVVVVISLEAPASKVMGQYDHLGLAIYELLLAQGRCVANHGIFVRGGVALGSFFFENDIMISPALAQAYELESKHAEFPVIVVPDYVRQAVFSAQKKSHYAPGADPTPKYFRRHGKRKWKGQALYYLDYLTTLALEEGDRWNSEDYEDYMDAKEKEDGLRAESALRRKALKGCALFFRVHRMKIEGAYSPSAPRRVRSKYLWLMRYHNSRLFKNVDYVKEELINIPSQFA